ncbi:DoxX family protein [Nonomuraea dietziae]|uniref:DoxX family protein n=1 Tax=Nonomuraea dietziae TaxID=65515 RepID=UPI0033C20D10
MGDVYGQPVGQLVGVGDRALPEAYLVVHQPRALWPLENEGELAAIYSWSFLLIAALGPGAWALDTLLARALGRKSVTPPRTA